MSSRGYMFLIHYVPTSPYVLSRVTGCCLRLLFAATADVELPACGIGSQNDYPGATCSTVNLITRISVHGVNERQGSLFGSGRFSFHRERSVVLTKGDTTGGTWRRTVRLARQLITAALRGTLSISGFPPTTQPRQQSATRLNP